MDVGKIVVWDADADVDAGADADNRCIDTNTDTDVEATDTWDVGMALNELGGEMTKTNGMALWMLPAHQVWVIPDVDALAEVVHGAIGVLLIGRSSTVFGQVRRWLRELGRAEFMGPVIVVPSSPASSNSARLEKENDLASRKGLHLVRESDPILALETALSLTTPSPRVKRSNPTHDPAHQDDDDDDNNTPPSTRQKTLQ